MRQPKETAAVPKVQDPGIHLITSVLWESNPITAPQQDNSHLSHSVPKSVSPGSRSWAVRPVLDLPLPLERSQGAGQMFAEHQTWRWCTWSSARLLLQVQRRSQPAQLFMVSLFWIPFKMFAVLCLETPLLLSAIVLPNSTVTHFVLSCLSFQG